MYRGTRTGTGRRPSVLAGKIVDTAGEPLIATHACKGKVRYRYYVSRSLQHGGGTGMRIPAREIEALVAEQIAHVLDDPLVLAGRTAMQIDVARIARFSEACQSLAARLRSRRSLPAELIEQVRVGAEQIEISVSTVTLATVVGATIDAAGPNTLTLTQSVRVKRSGRAVRLVHESGQVAGATAPDETLLKLLAKAWRWWDVLAAGTITIKELAAQEGVVDSYVSRVVRLRFLAPTLVEAVLEGRQPAALIGASLKAAGIEPLWQDQRRAWAVPEAA